MTKSPKPRRIPEPKVERPETVEDWISMFSLEVTRASYCLSKDEKKLLHECALEALKALED
jgi:hypothetical protein